MMRAITIGAEKGVACLRSNIPIPTPGRGQVLVKILFAGQNPPDAYVLDEERSAAYRHPKNVLGDDFLGVVVDGDVDALKTVPKQARVFGWVLGDVSVDGSYADYTVCDIDMLIRVPEEGKFDDKEFVALPFSFTTALHALESGLKLDVTPRKSHNATPVLVWGAGTACGMYAVQLLLRSGYEVLTVSGADTQATLQKFGATDTYLRNDSENAVKSIRSRWPNLRHALDCFASSESIKTCMRCLGEDGGQLHTLLPKEASMEQPANIKVTFDLVHCMYGKRNSILDMLPTAPSDEKLQAERALATKWFSYDRGLLYRMLIDNQITPLPVMEWGQNSKTGSSKGLKGVQEALSWAFEGKLPQGKIVHAISSE